MAVPSAPRYLTVTALDPWTARLSWQAPVDDGGAAITTYELAEDDDWRSLASSDTSVTLYGLTPYQAHTYRVRARNNDGSGVVGSSVVFAPQYDPEEDEAQGQVVPLLNVDRQHLLVRLGDIQCGLTVWYQPHDTSWYASLDIPLGTPWINSQRLIKDQAVGATRPRALPGQLVCRTLGYSTGDPGPGEPWGASHILRWEDD